MDWQGWLAQLQDWLFWKRMQNSIPLNGPTAIYRDSDLNVDPRYGIGMPGDIRMNQAEKYKNWNPAWVDKQQWELPQTGISNGWTRDPMPQIKEPIVAPSGSRWM